MLTQLLALIYKHCSKLLLSRILYLLNTYNLDFCQMCSSVWDYITTLARVLLAELSVLFCVTTFSNPDVNLSIICILCQQ